MSRRAACRWPGLVTSCYWAVALLLAGCATSDDVDAHRARRERRGHRGRARDPGPLSRPRGGVPRRRGQRRRGTGPRWRRRLALCHAERGQRHRAGFVRPRAIGEGARGRECRGRSAHRDARHEAARRERASGAGGAEGGESPGSGGAGSARRARVEAGRHRIDSRHGRLDHRRPPLYPCASRPAARNARGDPASGSRACRHSPGRRPHDDPPGGATTSTPGGGGDPGRRGRHPGRPSAEHPEPREAASRHRPAACGDRPDRRRHRESRRAAWASCRRPRRRSRTPATQLRASPHARADRRDRLGGRRGSRAVPALARRGRAPVEGVVISVVSAGDVIAPGATIAEIRRTGAGRVERVAAAGGPRGGVGGRRRRPWTRTGSARGCGDG